MEFRFASLGSGSAGNALLLEYGDTLLMVDCGFSVRETKRRMARLDCDPGQLTALLVTHEHADHAGGVFRLARACKCPVWLTAGTLRACAPEAAGCDCRIMDSHGAFFLGEIEIQPFPVPHDAREPVQFRFATPVGTLGLLTDVGVMTPHMQHMLADVEALVLEFNHDAAMLQASRYPANLKARIAGRFGHLENREALSFLATLCGRRLRRVVAAHLSRENNVPGIVAELLEKQLSAHAIDWLLACQETGFGWQRV